MGDLRANRRAKSLGRVLLPVLLVYGLVALLPAGLAGGHPLDPANVETVAGTGVRRETTGVNRPPGGWFTGDGGPATEAQLAAPKGIAVDPINGEIFVADTGSIRVGLAPPEIIGEPSTSNGEHNGGSDPRVRKITSGIISHVAGNEVGGPFTEVAAKDWKMPGLHSIAFDKRGNLFVVAPTFIFSLTRDPDNPDNPIDGSDNVTWVAGDGSLLAMDNVPAKESGLYHPYSVTFDDRNSMFIADESNNRIRRVSAGDDGVVDGGDGEIITTVAGTGVAGFTSDGVPATTSAIDNPTGVGFDSFGNLFIADKENHRVRKVVPGFDEEVNGGPDELITTVAGQGMNEVKGGGYNSNQEHLAATRADLNWPKSVEFDEAGNLLIADSYNNRIRKVSSGLDGVITGNDPGEVITGDDPGEIIDTIATDTPATPLDHPFGLALNRCKPGELFTDLYVSVWNSNRVQKLKGAAACNVVDLSILSFVADQAEALVGKPINLTAVATNSGTVAARGTKISVKNRSPAVVSYRSATMEGGTCQSSDSAVTCTLAAPLAAGGTAVLKLAAMPVAPGELVSQAVVNNTSPFDSNTANNTADLSRLIKAVVQPVGVNPTPTPTPSPQPTEPPPPPPVTKPPLVGSNPVDPSQAGGALPPAIPPGSGAPSVAPVSGPVPQSLQANMPVSGSLEAQKATALAPLTAPGTQSNSLPAVSTTGEEEERGEPAPRYLMTGLGGELAVNWLGAAGLLVLVGCFMSYRRTPDPWYADDGAFTSTPCPQPSTAY